MKPKHPGLTKFLTVCVAPVIAAMSPQSAQAVDNFWDENGATPGFGTAGATVTNWSNATSLFSLDGTGSTAPTGTQLPGSFDNAFFGTSTVGMAGGIITVSGNPAMSNPTFGSANTGSIEITGGQLNLGTTASLTITSNALGNRISSVLIGGNTAQTLTITGGTMTLFGANTFDRAVTVNGTGGGKLSVASVGSVGSASSNMGAPTTATTATVNLLGGGALSYTGTGETSDRVLNLSSGAGSGGIVEQSGSGLLKFTGGVTSTGASSKVLTIQGSSPGTGEISGVIANNSGTNLTSILKNGSGTWTLSNTANTYSGKTSINGGTLSVSSIGSINGGASGLGSVTTVANGTLDMSGNGRLLYTGTGETTNRVVNLVSGFGSGAILDQSGSGNLNITGGVTSTGTSSKLLTLQGSTAGTAEISGVIANNSVSNLTSILKLGTGTWTFSNAANTFSGKTSINGGTLSVSSIGSVNGGASNLGSVTTVANGTIDMTGGGRLLYTGPGETTDRVINLSSTFSGAAVLDQSGTGNLKFTSGVTSTGMSSKTITLQGSTAGTGEISGAIADNGGVNLTRVNKTGSGTWTLSSNSNTYTGTTTVTNGKLVVNGNISTGVVTVGTGATIAGSGTIAGNLAVNSGATLAPGNSAGNLTLGNGLTLAGSYAWQLTALSTANPGTDFDTVTVTSGSVDISGASLQLSLGAFAPSANAFWQTDQTWEDIINNTGAGILTGSFAAIDNSAWSSLGAFSTTVTDNDVNLIWTAVPEPASSVSLGVAGILMMLYRRRSMKN